MLIEACLVAKGGAGKSTHTIHKAVEAARAGQAVLVVDMDRTQFSASKWWKRRPVEDISLAQPQRHELKQTLSEARDTGFTRVFIDAPPHGGDLLHDIIAAADLITIPVIPTITDVEALQPTVNALQANNAERRALVVINKADSKRGVAENQDVIDALETISSLYPRLSICPHIVRKRVAFYRSMTGGFAVTEYEPNGLAAQEIRAVLDYTEQLEKEGTVS